MNIKEFYKTNIVNKQFNEILYQQQRPATKNFCQPYCKNNNIDDKHRLYFHYKLYVQHNYNNTQVFNSELSIKCPDGFANQIRLTLAANYLVSIGESQTAKQEWVLNNHNIVDYDKFFRRLKRVSFDKIDHTDVIETNSFCAMVSPYGNPKKILKTSFRDLKLLPIPRKIINEFVNNNDIKNCIGVHVRTGCKNALLKQSNTRNQSTSPEYIIDLLKNRNEKIYLATDNQETQSRFIDIFKDRIIIFQKLDSGKEEFEGKYERSKVTRNGTDIHVVADFFILKSCKYFIGSNESSFSIMINWLRDNPEDHELKGVL